MSQKPPYFKNQAPYSGDQEYTDDIFPHDVNALLGKDANGNPIDAEASSKAASLIKSGEIEFKRASELFKDTRYVFISDNIKMEDIVPGDIDDAYFLFAVQN